MRALAGAALSADVRELLRLLAKHRVEYLLLGGHAVFFHGYPRLTQDADVYFRSTDDNATRLFAALTEFWDGTIPGIAEAGELADPSLVVQFGRPPNRIDLLTAPDGLEFGEAWARRVATVLPDPGGDIPVLVIGLADLRVNKAAAGRPKDLDDLANLPLA